jgi:molybdate transport system ATP-binding protein
MPERPTPTLEIRARVAYPGFDLDLDERIDLAGVTGLFGPSGSGKSTLLRCIAGLERGSGGAVRFNGATWQESGANTFVRPWQRPVGYVFQDTRLFPHLTVTGNLQFAADRAVSDAGIGFDEVVDVLNIKALLSRRPMSLSGGEQQRVAVARALLSQPRLLLLDEPLAALDVGHKREILPYLEALPARFGIPAIFVSHAAGEMARLADDVIVLESGRVRARGPARDILGRESLDASVVPFEPVTILDVRVARQLPELGLTRVSHADQQLTVPAVERAVEGDAIRLLIRAGDVVLATSEPRDLSVRNVLKGTVIRAAELPDSAFAIVTVETDGVHLQAQLTRHAVSELSLTPGMPVFALIKTATFDRSL